MSTWRCGWICPRSYLFAAVFLAGVSAPCERRSIATSRNPFWPLGEALLHVATTPSRYTGPKSSVMLLLAITPDLLAGAGRLAHCLIWGGTNGAFRSETAGDPHHRPRRVLSRTNPVEHTKHVPNVDIVGHLGKMSRGKRNTFGRQLTASLRRHRLKVGPPPGNRHCYSTFERNARVRSCFGFPRTVDGLPASTTTPPSMKTI